MNKINSFTGFGKLNEVWLGATFPVDFYYDFAPEVRDAFVAITEMTNQDLDEIAQCLEANGVVVRRPVFTGNREDYLDSFGNLIKPPIMPRDNNLTLGDTLYHLRSDYKVNPWAYHLDQLALNNGKIEFGDRHSDLSCLAPPSVVRCGKDIFIDLDSHKHVMPQVSQTFINWAQQYRVHLVSTGGHSDSVFCPVREGLIISTHWLSDYSKTFPDWEVFSLPVEVPASYTNWWVPDSNVTNNSLFSRHIENKAIDWIGNYKETQFSVNMLVIDTNKVLAVNQNPKLTEFLNQQGIEVIVKDFRCKGFWDGGMHCLTCDINRSDSQIDYFPSRPKNNYLDWII
jgi:hypothetical protein